MSRAKRESRRRWRRELGVVLATFVVALIVSASMTTWLPPGAAELDHVIFAVVGFPLVWGALAMALIGARRRRRAWGVLALVGMGARVPVVGSFFA